GATFLTIRVNVAVAVRPKLSVAVMVTVIGPSGPSGGVYDQPQLPAEMPLYSADIVPSEAVRVPVPRPSRALKRPLSLATEPSLVVTTEEPEMLIPGGESWSNTLTLAASELATTRS